MKIDAYKMKTRKDTFQKFFSGLDRYFVDYFGHQCMRKIESIHGIMIESGNND